jgi:pullulanase
VLVASTDAVVKTARHDANGFYVPARTTAIFERAEQKSCSPFPVDMYVRGSFTGWADPPPDSSRLEFLGGKDYARSMAVTLPGDGNKPAFKIASADWNAAAYDCGVAPGTNAWLGIPVTLTCGKVTNFDSNLALQVADAGDYTFSLNAVTTTNPVVTVTRTPASSLPVFVRGGFNSWGQQPLVWDGESIYTSVGSVAAGTYQFKIATADWESLDCGGPKGQPNGSTSAVIGEELPLACRTSGAEQGPSNLGLTVTTAGDYVFAVKGTDPSALTLLVEPAPVTNIDPAANCPGDTNVFVRGLGGDWGCSASNKMNYLGFGTYRLDKPVVSGNVFKIATADWSTVNCGGPAGANVNVPIGATYTLVCGDPATTNLGVAAAAGGTYRFKYTRSDNKLLVTGP